MNKIGFLVMAHPDYINDGLAGSLADRAVKTIEASGAEVVRPAEFICDHKSAREASLKLLAEDVSGAVIFLASWVECPTVMASLCEIPALPIALWGFRLIHLENGGEASTGSYVSYAMLRGSLERMGRGFVPIMDEVDSPSAKEKLAQIAKAWSAKKRLMRSRIGLIGYSSMTIYPGTFDHLLLRSKIGPEVIHSDAYSLIRRAESASADYIDAACDKFRQNARICSDVSEDELRTAASLYCGLCDIKDEFDLDAVNAKCQYEFSKEYGMTLCTPLSLIADNDFVASCEGDILCTVSQLMLEYITGQTIGYGDALNGEGRSLKLSPCGFMPYGVCSEAGCEICGFMPGVGFSGIQNRCVMKPGKVTLLRLIEDVGGYHMLAFCGEGRRNSKPRQGYMPSLDIDLDFDISELESRYAGQHFALCYGDITGELSLLASTLGVDITIL